MAIFTEEELMAYADGVLTGERRRVIEAAVLADPSIGAQIDVYRVTGPTLGRFFADTLREPVPDRLIQAVRTGAPAVAPAARTAPLVSGSLSAWLGALVETMVPGRVAFAMSAAALAGLAGGWLAATKLGAPAPGVQPGAAQIALAADARLTQVLETTISTAAATAVAGGASVQLTFNDRQGRFCREYQIAGDAETASGIACRSDSGAWRVVAHVVAPRRRPIGSVGYVPASGRIMDAAIAEMKSGDTLDNEAEAQLIARGWRRD